MGKGSVKMIIAFDPGYKKVAWASYINEEFKVGYVHRGKHERIKYLLMIKELCEGMDVVIVEDQYIKRVSRRLQAAVAASVIKVRKAASEIETMAHLAGAEVIQCHPKTWQTIIKTPVGTKAVKKASKELAEYLLGKGRIGQDICDATCMLYWYITKRSTK
jgi:hypothetical protein